MVEEHDADEQDGHRRICELLCEAAITGRDADKLTSVVRALDLATGDMRTDLEILAGALRNETIAAGENPVQANVRVDRRCRESGFDPEAFIRREKRRRARTKDALAPLDGLRALVEGASADLDVTIHGFEDGSDLLPGAVVARLTSRPDDRAELWRRLVDEVATTNRWPLFAAEVDFDHADRSRDHLEESAGVDVAALLRDRTAQRGRVDDQGVHQDASAGPTPATGLCWDGYGARDPVLLLVPAASGPAALAQLAWDDGGTFTPGEHVAIARHVASAYGAQFAAVTYSTIEFVIDVPPHGAALDRATADRLAYGDTTFGTAELDGAASVRAATARDRVWGFWFD